MTIPVFIEASAKKSFACALEWPGWCRSGKTEALALESLAAYADRCAAVAAEAGLDFPNGAPLEVVDRVPGGSGTEFGVPSAIVELDRRPVDAAEAARLASLVAAAWRIFDRVATGAPAELRKGPRGGGRDRDKLVGHVVESDGHYERELGLRLPVPAPGDRLAVDTFRAAMLDVLARPSDGGPLAGRRWTLRYAARRIAWHALDHAWEIEDRSTAG